MVPVRARAIALVTGVAAVASLTLLPAARAETAADARAEAAALATQVAQLQQQTESASEAYAATSAELQTAVGAQVEARTAAQQAAEQAAGTGAAADDQVRALYEMGGPLVTYATFLQTDDPGDLVTSVQGARRQAADSQEITDAAAAASAHAQQQLVHADAAAQHVADLTAAAQGKAGQVTALLARQTALLAGADAEVRTLEKQEEQARLLHAQMAFLDQLRAAQRGQLDARLIGAGAGTDLSTTTDTDSALAAHARDPEVIAAVTAQAQQAATPLEQNALLASLTHLGAPYLWGGTGPTQFDCSGLVGAAYAAAGVILPRTAAQQYQSGPHPSLAELKPGDLLFWADDPKNPATIHHVAIYAGGNLMVSTDHTGDVARVQPIWADGFAGATRPDPTTAAQVPGPIWAPGTT